MENKVVDNREEQRIERESEYEVNVFIRETYFVKAKSREDAIRLVNLNGDPQTVTTIKQTVKKIRL